MNVFELEEMRSKVDDIADEALASAASMKELLNLCTGCAKNPEEVNNLHPSIAPFVESVLDTPAWIDAEKMVLGQRVFLRHFASAGLGLLYFSLIGGFSAPKIVKVLSSTSYLTENEEKTWKRWYFVSI